MLITSGILLNLSILCIFDIHRSRIQEEVNKSGDVVPFLLPFRRREQFAGVKEAAYLSEVCVLVRTSERVVTEN